MDYPPPPPPSSYGYPPPTGYGYGQQYGYPQPVQQPAPPTNPYANPTVDRVESSPSSGLPWSGVIAAVVVTALLAVGATYFAMHHPSAPAATPAHVIVDGSGVQPGRASALAQQQAEVLLKGDLKAAVIAEESYATDNNGRYVATSSGDKSSPLYTDGLTVSPDSLVTVVVFTTSMTNDSFCVTGVSSKTAATWYINSVDNVLTQVKPVGC